MILNSTVWSSDILNSLVAILLLRRQFNSLFPSMAEDLNSRQLRNKCSQSETRTRGSGSRFLRAYSQATLPSHPGSLIVDWIKRLWKYMTVSNKVYF